MTKMVPIAITILSHNDQYLFIKRRNPPYEGLWSMIGGKIGIGEHIQDAAIREVLEETGTPSVTDYEYRGVVSERLVDIDGNLVAHFLIFVGYASIESYVKNHREGDLALFAEQEVESNSANFLPSDLEMFKRFLRKGTHSYLHEVELLHDKKGYHIEYYREITDEDQ